MAKVVSPLLSLSASGNIGGILNFKNWAGLSVVRKYTRPILPPDPHTNKQIFNRQYFTDIVKVWQNLNSVVKNELDIDAEEKQQSGFNLHVSAYFKQKPSTVGVCRIGFSELGGLTREN